MLWIVKDGGRRLMTMMTLLVGSWKVIQHVKSCSSYLKKFFLQHHTHFVVNVERWLVKQNIKRK